MGTIASQITSLTIVYSTLYSDADQRKHQSSASLTFVWGIHRGPVNSPHKWPVTRKMFPFDDDIMGKCICKYCLRNITQFLQASFCFHISHLPLFLNTVIWRQYPAICESLPGIPVDQMVLQVEKERNFYNNSM